ncbi:hypothetical protein ASD76_11640 [Altererythrobacter sp. Root672]|nr:hypothetical protein ASD76_11640 [Altererythrobacter sp. Root672]
MVAVIGCNFRESRQLLNIRHAMMAMPVDTHPIVVRARYLMIAGFVSASNCQNADFRRRLARHNVHGSAEHYAQKQQQCRKASSATMGQQAKHFGLSTSYRFTFSHPLSPTGSRSRIEASERDS